MNTQAFPRQARLLKPADFKRVFEDPLSSRDRLFKVVARGNGLGYSRLGMAVSRRVDPRAAARNRIKRVIRESFRLRHPAQSECSMKGVSRDYVVLPAASTASISNGELRRSLEEHWQRIDREMDKAREASGPLSRARPNDQHQE